MMKFFWLLFQPENLGITLVASILIFLLVTMLVCSCCCRHSIEEINEFWASLSSYTPDSMVQGGGSGSTGMINPLAEPSSVGSFGQNIDEEDEGPIHEVVGLPVSGFATTQV